MRLLDFFENTYVPQRLLGKSPKTIRLYKCSIKCFSDHLGRAATLADLTDESLAPFLLWRISQTSRASANKDRVQICAIWRFANAKQMVDKLPTIPSIVSPEQIPIAWTLEEMARLFEACKSTTGVYYDRKDARWVMTQAAFWFALVSVIWETGERIGAVMSLERSDIAGEFISFRAETRKGGKLPTAKRLRPETSGLVLCLLDQWIDPQATDKVFPWALNDNQLWAHFRAVIRSAGLPSGRKYMFHCIRKSVASHVEANGGDAQKALNHASRVSTAKYLDPRIVKPVQPIDHLPVV